MDPDYVDGRLVYTVGAAVFMVLLILSAAYFFVFASPPDTPPPRPAIATVPDVAGDTPTPGSPSAEHLAPEPSAAR